jgi:hypothetical protein
MKTERMAFQTETREKLSDSENARYKILDGNSVAIVGEDEVGRKVFDIQFPHVSANTAEEFVETNKAAEKIWDKELRNAVRTELLTPDQAKRAKLEGGAHVSFQNQAKEAFGRIKREDIASGEGKVIDKRISPPPAKVWKTPRRAVSGARLLTVGGIVMTAASACVVPEVSPTPRPTQTFVAETPMEAVRPTASPEVVNSLNESAQKITDEAFADLGVHDVVLIGAGTLTDSSGAEFALFNSKLPDKKTGKDLDFLLLSELGEGNQIKTIKGLVINEEETTEPILEFLAVSFDKDTQTFVVEGPYIRTNTQTEDIEVFKNGAWQMLNGPEKTIDDVKKNLGIGVLTALALPTPTPEVEVQEGLSRELVAKWEEMGYPKDLREGGTITTVEKIINGQRREFLAWRVGWTYLMMDKELIDLDADIGPYDEHKYSGEMAIPNPNEPGSLEQIEMLGALVHATNLDIVGWSQGEYDPAWYENYLISLKENPDTTYVLEANLPIPGKPGSYKIGEVGTINASLPVEFIILPPRMEKDRALGPQKIIGGHPSAPFGLEWRERHVGYFGVDISGEGGFGVLASEFLIDGRLRGSKYLGPNIVSYMTQLISAPAYIRMANTSFGPGADREFVKTLFRIYYGTGKWGETLSFVWGTPE